METNTKGAAVAKTAAKPGKGSSTFWKLFKAALKGTLISMVFTVAVTLLFALVIKETGMKDNAIGIINQVVKIGGILLASFFAVKGLQEKQWLVGGLAGILFIVLSYLIFSLIEGVFGNVAVLFSNLLMGLLIGLVFAIIIANFFGAGKRVGGAKKSKSGKPRRMAMKKAG
jgi:putative membrane protein (TIGR04086 family)